MQYAPIPTLYAIALMLRCEYQTTKPGPVNRSFMLDKLGSLMHGLDSSGAAPTMSLAMFLRCGGRPQERPVATAVFLLAGCVHGALCSGHVTGAVNWLNVELKKRYSNRGVETLNLPTTSSAVLNGFSSLAATLNALMSVNVTPEDILADMRGPAAARRLIAEQKGTALQSELWVLKTSMLEVFKGLHVVYSTVNPATYESKSRVLKLGFLQLEIETNNATQILTAVAEDICEQTGSSLELMLAVFMMARWPLNTPYIQRLNILRGRLSILEADHDGAEVLVSVPAAFDDLVETIEQMLYRGSVTVQKVVEVTRNINAGTAQTTAPTAGPSKAQGKSEGSAESPSSWAEAFPDAFFDKVVEDMFFPHGRNRVGPISAGGFPHGKLLLEPTERAGAIRRHPRLCYELQPSQVYLERRVQVLTEQLAVRQAANRLLEKEHEALKKDKYISDQHASLYKKEYVLASEELLTQKQTSSALRAEIERLKQGMRNLLGEAKK